MNTPASSFAAIKNLPGELKRISTVEKEGGKL